jgi:hypothetical protein
MAGDVAAHDNVNVMTADAGNFLPFTTDASISLDKGVMTADVLGQEYEKECTRYLMSSIDWTMRSDLASGCPVSGLNLSAGTLDSLDFTDYMTSLQLTLTNKYKDIRGPNDNSVYRRRIGASISATLNMNVPLDASTLGALLAQIHSGTFSDANMVLAFTLNSVAFSVPFLAKSASHKLPAMDVQTWAINLSPGGAPTAPTGTTTLLTKALNAGDTAQALVCESKAVNGMSYSGDFKPESMSFTIDLDNATLTSYRYLSHGDTTVAITS